VNEDDARNSLAYFHWTMAKEERRGIKKVAVDPTRERFSLFAKNNSQAVRNIRTMLNSTEEYELEFAHLVKWLMTTEQNPYGFLPEEWAGSTTTAPAFESLCNYIHHAMVDDGDITFYMLEDEPRIAFKNRNDEDFAESVLTSTEKYFRNRSGHRYQVKFLPNAYEFVKAIDAYHESWLKRCFMNDSYRGVDWAANHYRTNHPKTFKEEWVLEAMKEKT
jgi:hypothetical protein